MGVLFLKTLYITEKKIQKKNEIKGSTEMQPVCVCVSFSYIPLMMSLRVCFIDCMLKKRKNYPNENSYFKSTAIIRVFNSS